jgi:DNA-binding response OmpR family regulator
MNTIKKTILVIEDEKLLLEAISKKLTLNNFTVLSYSSGISAITDLISKRIAPDSIWLDYYLVDMNGMEFITEMQKQNITTPVIIVSNSTSDTKVKTMLALGVKKYILKAHHRLEDIILELKNIMNDVS